MKIMFAILKIIEQEIKVAEKVDNSYLICYEEIFRKSIHERLKIKLKSKNLKKKLGKNKYSYDDVINCFEASLNEWITDFKRETLTLK